MLNLANYIDGKLVPAAADGWLDDYEPATGRRYARLPDSHKTDIDAAVAAAQRAFPVWSAMPAARRSEWLRRRIRLTVVDFSSNQGLADRLLDWVVDRYDVQVVPRGADFVLHSCYGYDVLRHSGVRIFEIGRAHV